MITVAFFNNKGGVGKTSLVYHLGWTYADLDRRVLLADLDPQADLTGFCVDDRALEQLWPEEDERRPTVFGAIQPIKENLGGIRKTELIELTSRLSLLPGDLRLGTFEAKLNEAWPQCRSAATAGPGFRAVTAFHCLIQQCGAAMEADIALLDLGTDLGKLNQAALLAADWIVVPLAADLFSLQALRNIGLAFEEWRASWEELQRLAFAPTYLPDGSFRSAGYVVTQPHSWVGRFSNAYELGNRQIPTEYRKWVSMGNGELGKIGHYLSLMPLAQKAHKPIFHLTAADGALGGHFYKANEAGSDFRALARSIAQRIGLDLHPGARYSSASG